MRALLFAEIYMLSVKIICVGKIREKYYSDAFMEYAKRLSAYCSFDWIELQEFRLPDHPGDKEIFNALEKEADVIIKELPQRAYVVAFCIEGTKMTSVQFADLLRECQNSGRSKLCFLIGGSYGLAERVKKQADIRLSVSDMTFPHHLARVMVAEQIYRGFKINEGSAYHK